MRRPSRRIITRAEPGTGALLEVTDLKTQFRTPRGMVRAVDGVTFAIDRGKTLGIVGESGSGKTVLSRSIMGLLPSNAEVTGTVLYEAHDITGQNRDITQKAAD